METTARAIPLEDTGIASPLGEDHEHPIDIKIASLCNSDAAHDNNQKGLLSKVRCDANTINEAKDIAWIPHEPYSSSRPLSSPEKQSLHLRAGRPINQESFNYAKALLESDKELERLAEKICSDISDSEMLEVALLAEKAAAEGMETFSSQPYTFGGGDPIPLKRHASYSEGLSVFPTLSSSSNNVKIKARDLRHVSEVIPDFGELHSHMRTHLFRQNVEEKTLLYKAVELDNDGKEDESENNIEPAVSKRPFNLFQRISLRALQQKSDTPLEEEKIATLPEGGSSSSSASEAFGGRILSSNLYQDSSNRKFKTQKTQSLDVPHGLSYPDHTQQSFPTSDKTDSYEPLSPVTDAWNGQKRSLGFQQPSNSDTEFETPRETISLFDEDNDDGSRPSSPQDFTTDADHPPPLYPETAMTPKVKDYYQNQGPEFFTPERLRDIRDNTTFSPSSIVESSNGLDQDMSPPHNQRRLHEDETTFLQLPKIKDKPKEKQDFSSSKERAKNHNICLPQRRIDLDIKEESTCVEPEVPLLPKLSEKPPNHKFVEHRQDDLPAFPESMSKDVQDPPSSPLASHRRSGTYWTAGRFPKRIGLKRVSSWPGKNQSWISRTASVDTEMTSKERLMSLKSNGDEESSSGNFPVGEEGAKSALRKMLSHLSPTFVGEGTSGSFKESENNEFLSNYFYVPKPKGRGKAFARQSHINSLNCARHGMLCSGVESVCAGLDFLFIEKTEAGKKTGDIRGKERSMSMNGGDKPSKGWLNLLARNKFGFEFNNPPESSDGKEVFQPPLTMPNFGKAQ